MKIKNTGAQTLEKGLFTLECVVDHKTVSITKLAKQMGINKSTLYRYLTTLKKMGYLAQDENDGYYLTDKLMKMASGVVPQMEIRELVLPYLEEMARLSGYNSNLGFWNGIEILYLAQKRPHPFAGFSVGETIPAYCSALGKAILAHLSEKDLQEYINRVEFKKYSKKTVTDAESLLKELEEIRVKGFALMDGEMLDGLIGIALPLQLDSNFPVYAISLAGSKESNTENFVAACLPILQKAALEISAKIIKRNSMFNRTS